MEEIKEIQDIDLKALIERETGQRFNKDNKINSPFTNEKTPSFSVYFNSNKNKWQFKDFSGSNKYGDAIDFIMEYKNLDYKQAREYLGLEVTKSPTEDFEDIIKNYVSKQVKSGNKQGYKPLGIFTFVDENNNPIYAKVKFLKPDGKKETPYYSIQDGQVFNKRLHDEVPYNYYNLLHGIAQNKTIVFLEGEKDVNTINNTLSKKDYVATSIKGFKDYDKIKGEFMKIAVIGDTGTAGQKYVENIKFNFLKAASSFKIINLPGIKSLGDNKDVTDWLQAGHTKAELLKAFDRSLDLKDKFELQQDEKGIYKLKTSGEDEEKKFTKSYLTDFNILEASKINRVDEGTQNIKLKIKSCIDGKIVEKIGPSKIFDDLRTFRNFLGMDFSFTGINVGELVKLKGWVNKYFAVDNSEINIGTKILPIEGTEQFKIITSTGTLLPTGMDRNCISESNNISILDIEPIEKNELQELMQHLFRFINYNQAYCLIGSAISFLEVAQSIALDTQLHHLFLLGESQTGKTTILEKVLMPLLNYPKADKKTMSSTIHSIKEELAIGNYPIVYEEFKPSKMTQYKKDELSNILRSAYDRDAISRGDKGFGVKDVKLARPLIIAGEEMIPGNEKAIITRSCIVYMGKGERTKETSNSIFWLEDHRELLNKLGKSLILEVLSLPIEEYKQLRINLRDKFALKDRPLNTAINISCGIELLNKVLIKQGLQPVEDYHQSIEANIREEILSNGDDTDSVVEQMIIQFNDILQDRNYPGIYKAIQTETKNGKKIYIRSQMLVDYLFKYQKDYQSLDISLIKIKDFRKQAKKSGYIVKVNAKQFTDNDRNSLSYGSKAWYDEYDVDKLLALNVGEIVEPEDALFEEAVTRAEQNIFSVAR
ncbi:CHC2 zinc finger domain-containing protein [Clostridium beijerinckii]|uniref:CHC2 zinc finger domain-containing protein n=1 Tax=Clostridium beijerinckii TaxID=1520 RepID=UPI00232FE7ED|nr:CHC2 zinc finger domain-containing protein [Clostridium beijerinckii]